MNLVVLNDKKAISGIEYGDICDMGMQWRYTHVHQKRGIGVLT